MVLAINESFSICRILTKLNSLDDTNEYTIHFNFTLLPPGVCLISMHGHKFDCIAIIQNNVADEERKQFTQLMDKIGWFIFDLFILGYVHDSHTGMTFAVPKGVNWKVYIEV